MQEVPGSNPGSPTRFLKELQPGALLTEWGQTCLSLISRTHYLNSQSVVIEVSKAIGLALQNFHFGVEGLSAPHRVLSHGPFACRRNVKVWNEMCKGMDARRKNASSISRYGRSQIYENTEIVFDDCHCGPFDGHRSSCGRAGCGKHWRAACLSVRIL